MKKFLFLILFLFSVAIFAAEDFYNFSNKEQEKRFRDLTLNLRCLVCQNQNLAESNASLAADLRQQVYQKIISGESDQQIIDYLVSRYGNFILYRPPFNTKTLVLWAGPFLVLCFGMIFLWRALRKR